VDFKNSTIEAYSDSKKYDYVFCLNAINHVADIYLAYQKISGLLAENGQLIFSIDAHNYSLFKKLFRAVPGDILHPHQYDLTEYELMLNEVGLKVKKTVKLKQEFFFNHYVLLATKC
jgi:2-polyprenyl-6-hydroxyphenyl methylase/3-demethylubiquinone-9 3-methyltransferase